MNKLPTEPRERVVFCFAFGDKFDGDNFEEALRYARFVVLYTKGMGMPPFATIASGTQST
jgi:hypothetical protein